MATLARLLRRLRLAMPWATSGGCFLLAYVALAVCALSLFSMHINTRHVGDHHRAAPLVFGHQSSSLPASGIERDVREAYKVTLSELGMAVESMRSAMNASGVDTADEVIVFAHRVPLFDTAGGDLRTLKLVRALCALNLTVRFVAMARVNPDPRTPYYRALRWACATDRIHIYGSHQVSRLVETLHTREMANAPPPVPGARGGQAERGPAALLAVVHRITYNPLTAFEGGTSYGKFGSLLRARFPLALSIISRDEVIADHESRRKTAMWGSRMADPFAGVAQVVMRDEKEALNAVDYAVYPSESDARSAAIFAMRPQADFGVVRFAYLRADTLALTSLLLGRAVPTASSLTTTATLNPSGTLGLDFQLRSHLLFFGAGDNTDNTVAVEWFAEAVLPLVRESVPECKLTVAGRVQPPSRNQRRTTQFDTRRGANKRGVAGAQADTQEEAKEPAAIEFVGPVNDLSTLIDGSRVFVSPVLNGGGLNTKTILTLAHGLPVVTTSVGAMGLPHARSASLHRARSLRHRYLLPFIVADTAPEFAAAVAALYADEELWTHMARNAQVYARQHFSDEGSAADVANAVAAALVRKSERAVRPYMHS